MDPKYPDEINQTMQWLASNGQTILAQSIEQGKPAERAKKELLEHWPDVQDVIKKMYTITEPWVVDQLVESIMKVIDLKSPTGLNEFRGLLNDRQWFFIYTDILYFTQGQFKFSDNKALWRRSIKNLTIWNVLTKDESESLINLNNWFSFEDIFQNLRSGKKDIETFAAWADMIQGFDLKMDTITSIESFDHELTQVADAINGGFDKGNHWHQAVNFLQLRLIEIREGQTRPLTIEAYLNLLNGSQDVEQVYGVKKGDLVHLKGLSVEAYHLAKFIIQRMAAAKAHDRELVVVANKSYGTMALAPIRPWLDRQGIKVIETKIASTDSHTNPLVIDFQNKQLFSDDDIKLFAAKSPDVIVVDGSYSLDPVRMAQFNRQVPRFPDAYQGYRNFFLAINDGITPAGQNQNPQEFQKNTHFLEKLRMSRKYEDIRNKASTYAEGRTGALYKMRFWTPAFGSREGALLFSEDRVIRSDVVPPIYKENEDEQGPTLIFVESCIENRLHPNGSKENPTITSEVRNWMGGDARPAFFDDNKENFFRMNYSFEDGFGIMKTKYYFKVAEMLVRDYIKHFDPDLLPQFEPVISDLKAQPLKGYIFDLTGTLTSFTQPISDRVKHGLEGLLKKKKVAIITDDSDADNIEGRVINRINPYLRKNLSIYLNSGNTLWQFDSAGNKQVIFDNKLSETTRKALTDVFERILARRGYKAGDWGFERNPYAVGIKMRGSLRDNKRRDQIRAGILDEVKAEAAKLGIEGGWCYLIGRSTVRYSVLHKVDAGRDFQKRNILNEEDLLIAVNEAGSRRNDRELVKSFTKSIKINVGRISYSLVEKNIPNVYQIIDVGDVTGVGRIDMVFNALDQKGSFVPQKLEPFVFVPEEKSTRDYAQLAAKGGIDLTPANMNLQTQNAGGEIKFHLDPAMLKQLQNVPGFVPVIINIQPMTDLRAFLGLGTANQPQLNQAN